MKSEKKIKLLIQFKYNSNQNKSKYKNLIKTTTISNLKTLIKQNIESTSEIDGKINQS